MSDARELWFTRYCASKGAGSLLYFWWWNEWENYRYCNDCWYIFAWTLEENSHEKEGFVMTKKAESRIFGSFLGQTLSKWKAKWANWRWAFQVKFSFDCMLFLLFDNTLIGWYNDNRILFLLFFGFIFCFLEFLSNIFLAAHWV